MNSLLYYYNNVQKMAAYRQAKRMQSGVKLGENQYGDQTNDKRFESAPIPIGTSDFSLEFYMNSSGSNQAFPFVFNRMVYTPSEKGGISLYNGNSYINGIYSILMEAPAEGVSYADSIYPFWQAPTADEKFLLTITRQGTTVKVYINGELKATKEQSEVKDLGNLQLAIANSSDVGFVRVWNYALSADEIATLYNNGDTMGYVVPKAIRDGLLAEYLPHNLMYGRDDKAIATSWLDSAKQLPLSDEYMEPLFQSIGGYDMTVNGAPEIIYRTYDYLGINFRNQQNLNSLTSIRLITDKNIGIGESDFTLQYYGNFYYSGLGGNLSCVFDNNNFSNGFRSYGRNYVEWVLFDSVISDGVNIPYPTGIDFTQKFNLVITRKGASVKAYINGELKATKEQSEVKDLGNIVFGVSNSSDLSVVRIFNKCLSDSEVSQLENSGDPAGYVLPAEMKTGDQRCIAEYLAMNLVPQKYKPTVAARWLDSATVLPDPDGTLRRIWKSVGGYDMEANRNPIILQ